MALLEEDWTIRDVVQAELIQRSGRDLELRTLRAWISKSDLLIVISHGSIALNDFSSPTYTNGDHDVRKADSSRMNFFAQNRYPFREVVCHGYA